MYFDKSYQSGKFLVNPYQWYIQAYNVAVYRIKFFPVGG